MIGKEVTESKPVSIHTAMEILEEKRKGEPTYEQQVALEHAKKVATTTKAKADKLQKALEALGLLNNKTILKILEIMPKNMMLLRQILAREGKAFSDDDVKKILALVKEHA